MRPTVILTRAIFVITFLVCIQGVASAQFKLGFVDSDVIVQSLPEFKAIESKLGEYKKSYEDTLRMIQTRFQTELEAYKKQEATLNAEAKSQKEAFLNNLNDQFAQYQQERLGPQGTIYQIQAQLLQPVRDKVRAAIEKIAKDEKLSAVMESSMFMYIDSKANQNITFKVLDYLTRDSK